METCKSCLINSLFLISSVSNKSYLVFSLMNGLHIYKASAGSGKTYTLGLSFLGIILQHDRPDAYREVLAMTFTNKAAGEMKDRILDFLSQLAEFKKGDDLALMSQLSEQIQTPPEIISARAKKCLHHILHNYSDLSILTLDKFIQNIIRSFSKELDFTKQFKIASNSDLIYKQAIDELLNNIEWNNELSQILKGYSLHKALSGKSYKTEDDLMMATRHLSVESSNEAIKNISEFSIHDFSNALKQAESELDQVLAKLKQNARNFSQILASKSLSYRDIKTGFRKIYNMGDPRFLDSKKYNFTEKELAALETGPLYPKTGTSSGTATLLDEIFPELSQTLLSSQALIREYEKLSLAIPALYNTAVISEISKIIERIKTEQNLLFFIDFNRLSSEIIRNEPVPFIYERTGTRYHHLMLDEFQDTSETQWHNLLPLMVEALSKNGLGLIVGDEKQAIYRWRNGNVEQFMNLPQLSLPKELDPHTFNLERHLKKNITLPKNYRSGKDIVAFNNVLFKTLREDLTPFYRQIYENFTAEPNQTSSGYVEVRYADRESLKSRNEQAFNETAIIETIQSLRNRNYAYSDIAILVRQKKEATAIANFLTTEHQIPVISPESLRIDNSPNIQLLFSFLKHGINPSENVYRLGILKYYAAAKNVSYQDLISKYTVTRNKHLIVDISAFLSQFGLRLGHKEDISISALIRQVSSAFGLDIFQINLQFFLNAIIEFESDQMVSTKAFIEWWEDNRENLNVSLPEDYNAVKIMTVHKSKGLEFPVCIIPYLNWKDDVKGEAWVDSEGTEIPQILMPYRTAQTKIESYAPTYELEKDRVKLDKINLLYVALTRAEKEMYLFTSKDLGAKIMTGCEAILTEKSSVYFYGEQQTHESIERREPLSIAYKISENPVIEYSTEAPDKWIDDDMIDEQTFGELMHLALSKIRSLEDIEPVVDQIFMDKSTGKHQQTLKSKITSLMNHEDIAPLYHQDFEHYSETNLSSPSGKLLRPDKVIKTPEKLVVLEFKTGKKSAAHDKQLLEYGHVLNSITEKNVDLYLIYLDPLEVLKL